MTTIDQAALDGLTEIFRVLGDPTRLRILDLLSRGELCVGDLASQLRVTESAVSHQLRLLRSARIVRARREGRMIIYSLDDTHVLTLFEQGLRHVQETGHAQKPAAEVAAPASMGAAASKSSSAVVSSKPAEGSVASKPSSGGRASGLVAPKLATEGHGASKPSSGLVAPKLAGEGPGSPKSTSGGGGGR
jgi:ArsR family transcriptional regulator, lead/cadmium/zinc/bismuth-responsive transcriptional repressor